MYLVIELNTMFKKNIKIKYERVKFLFLKIKKFFFNNKSLNTKNDGVSAYVPIDIFTIYRYLSALNERFPCHRFVFFFFIYI